MNVIRSHAQTTKAGAAAWFTGAVWIDEIASGADPARVRVLRVSFAPGARTAWHTHPAGQTLHILAGEGRVQKAGEASIEVQPGDTIWIEPGERHWHGAAPQRSMVHLAVQAEPEGKGTAWFEPVSDADYGAR
jgi:quercetin dioxygenase-like cupin family protein